MSLKREKLRTIDAIGVERSSEKIILTVFDDMDWNDVASHVSALEAKLDAYFDFIEDGEIFVTYPRSTGKSLVIDIIGRYPLPAAGLPVIENARRIAKEMEVEVRSRVAEGYEV